MPATIRQLTKDDYGAAEHIIKTSFSHKLGIPDPDLFFAGGSLLGRFLMDPDGVFGAEENGELVGVNIATTWGSFGYLVHWQSPPVTRDRALPSSC